MTRLLQWSFSVILATGLLFGQAPVATAQELSDTVRLVHFPVGTDKDQVSAQIAQQGGLLLDWLPALGVAQVSLPPNGRRSSALPAGLFVEYDHQVTGQYLPNDPGFDQEETGYAFQMVELEPAWTETQGDPNVVVAILDTGVYTAHPELHDVLLPGFDFVNDDNDPSDDHGHGTHVAGIVSAAMDNHVGVAGVCPRCSLLPVKVLNEDNLGSWFTIAQGIVYAADQGADIINLSLGATVGSQTLRLALDYAGDNGVLVIAAAGNTSTWRAFYPAAYEDVMSVGAVNRFGELWVLSNGGEFVDLVAPGQAIYGPSMDLTNAYGGYEFRSGTSMAAPFVAGIAGLLLSVEPTLTPEDVRSRLQSGAVHLEVQSAGETVSYAGVSAAGALGLEPEPHDTGNEEPETDTTSAPDDEGATGESPPSDQVQAAEREQLLFLPLANG